MKREIDMRVTLRPAELPGETSFEIDMDGRQIRIENEYGRTVLEWEEFDAVAAEVARFRKAQDVANG